MRFNTAIIILGGWCFWTTMMGLHVVFGERGMVRKGEIIIGEALFCQEGWFPCQDNFTCVEQRYNCDDTEDCPDGSDEWDCEDNHRKKYWNTMYRKRPDEDREKETTVCALSTIPSECHCSGRRLFCVHRNLLHVPILPDSSVLEIDLSGNQLETLNTSRLKALPSLETLIFTASGIKYIREDSFWPFNNLKKLYLTGNEIQSLKNNTFSFTPFLNLLILSHNPLKEIAVNAFDGLMQLLELDLRECQICELHPATFHSLTRLLYLFLDGNQIDILPSDIFSSLTQLTTLSLSRNKLKNIDESNFHGLSSLLSLSLGSNRLRVLEDSSFGNLTNLEKLDLHGNSLESLSPGTFTQLTRLQSLNLKGNALRSLKEETFSNLSELHHIYFDDFSFCSSALHVRVCEPHGDGISSIANLLDNSVLRVSVWLVSGISCFGNLFVLVGRLLIKEKNAVHSFYIKNLALADMSMGVYLLIVAGHDVAYRGVYIQRENNWRSSWQCRLCGFLNTVSCEASVLILAVITADRYSSILFPLSLKRRTLTFARIIMASLWAIAMVVSALPLFGIPYFGDEYYGQNGVCLPLHIHEPYARAWEYSTTIFCGLNSVAFLAVAYAYCAMFATITESKNGLRSSQQQQDRAIAKRFAFIVATDFLCWMPVVLIKVLALAGVRISDDLYGWCAVFLLPVNAALNPVLYTLTTKVFKKEIRKTIRTWTGEKRHKGGAIQDVTVLTTLSNSFSHNNWSKPSSKRTVSRTFSDGSDTRRLEFSTGTGWREGSRTTQR